MPSWQLDDASVIAEADAENSCYVSLGAVLAKDDSVIHLLEAPEGADFRRDPDSGLFVPV